MQTLFLLTSEKTYSEILHYWLFYLPENAARQEMSCLLLLFGCLQYSFCCCSLPSSFLQSIAKVWLLARYFHLLNLELDALSERANGANWNWIFFCACVSDIKTGWVLKEEFSLLSQRACVYEPRLALSGVLIREIRVSAKWDLTKVWLRSHRSWSGLM